MSNEQLLFLDVLLELGDLEMDVISARHDSEQRTRAHLVENQFM